MVQTLGEGQRQALLQLARAAVARAIGMPSTLASSPAIAVRAGAFVSLYLGHDLRGCIGYLEADSPLVDVVERCAASAAVSDPRFPSLGPAEWQGVPVELSALGPLVLVPQI